MVVVLPPVVRDEVVRGLPGRVEVLGVPGGFVRAAQAEQGLAVVVYDRREGDDVELVVQVVYELSGFELVFQDSVRYFDKQALVFVVIEHALVGFQHK